MNETGLIPIRRTQDCRNAWFRNVNNKVQAQVPIKITTITFSPFYSTFALFGTDKSGVKFAVKVVDNTQYRRIARILGKQYLKELVKQKAQVSLMETSIYDVDLALFPRLHNLWISGKSFFSVNREYRDLPTSNYDDYLTNSHPGGRDEPFKLYFDTKPICKSVRKK